jgi:hypothetical protein
MIEDPFASSSNLPPGLEPPPGSLPPPGSSGEGLPWIDIMIKALTQPNEPGYTQIANDPGVSIGRAALWYTLSALFAVFITLALNFVFNPTVFNSLRDLGLSGNDTAAFGAVAVGFLICLIPVGAVFSTISLMIGTAINQLIARMFGGKGSFGQLFYTYSAFLTPLMPVSALLGSIPFVSCLSIFLTVFIIYLQVLSVKAANRFGWGPAIAAVVLPFILIFALTCCALVAAALLFGPELQKYIPSVPTGQY